MSNSPNVVVVNMFTPSFQNLNFKYPTKDRVHSATMNMFDYYAHNKKKAFFMLDYFQGKFGKEKEMNIMFENGEYATQEQIDKRKKQYEKYIENSNIEKLVISFPAGYLEENVDIKKFEKDMAKHIIPMFLKKCGYADIKNMSYQFALHTDKEHLHFHLSFCEKKPNYKVNGNKLSYRHAGKLTQKELGFFKNEIEHYIEKEKYFTPLLKETNKELEELKSYFNPKDKNFLLKDKEDLLLEDKILKLGELLSETRDNDNRIKFGSIKDKEIIKLTKEIKKYIFSKKDTEFYVSHQEFKNSLNLINEYFKEIAKSNHTDIVDDSLIKNKTKYLDNYVLNAIVNHANYMQRQSKISEDEMIHNIIYKNYKNTKTRNRFNILSNYLSSLSKSSKFVNKYKIKEAVKNINNELEDAQREFDKLFKVDKEYE